MMRPDDTVDVEIRIVADRRRGIWSYMLIPRGQRSVQVAGRLNAEASRFTLFAAALIAASRSITKRKIEALQIARRRKLLVRVTTFEENFGPVIIALLKGNSGIPGKVGNNFRGEILRQCSRFDLVFETDKDHGALLTLLNWSRNSVFSERYLEETPAPFRPILASQLVPNR